MSLLIGPALLAECLKKPHVAALPNHLKRAREDAHHAFDRLWMPQPGRQGRGRMTRTGAYSWLAKALKIPRHTCHISDFDVATCERVVDVCRKAFKRAAP